MKRSNFIKLIAAGTFSPVICSYACSNSKEKKPKNSDPVEVSSGSKNISKKAATVENTYTSIAELKKAEPPHVSKLNTNEGYRVRLLGYYKPGDGGGGVFYWDAGSTEVDNSGTIIKPGSDVFKGEGRWKRFINNDKINVKYFGARGDGSGFDDQPAIQKTIDYAFNKDIEQVIIPEGDYTLRLNLKEIRPTSLILKDNTHLIMEKNTILRLAEGENEVKYNLLSVVDRKKVTIEGGTIVGNKLTRKGKPKGEHGMGISLVSCEDITIRGMNLREQWGDGIYIGRYGGKDSKCKNIEIRDTICDNNRRQGMSIVSVDGLQVENCEFNNTGGTRPEAGIDFEPNNVDEVLQNIKLRNIRLNNNNGAGILFVLSRLESPDEPKITIDIKDVYVKNSGKIGIAITKHFNVPGTGYINFENITVKNNGSRAAYYVRNWHKDAPPITFKNIVAINPNTSGQGGTTQGSALVFFDNDPGYDKGNLHVNGFQVKNDSSATGKAPKDIFVERNLWNCSFQDIKSNPKDLHSIHLLDKKKNNALSSEVLNILNKKQ